MALMPPAQRYKVSYRYKTEPVQNDIVTAHGTDEARSMVMDERPEAAYIGTQYLGDAKPYVVSLARSGSVIAYKDVEVQAESNTAAIHLAVTQNLGWHFDNKIREGRLITEAEPNASLWAEDWKPSVSEGEEVTLATIVAQAIGSGSMCWENVNEAGTFKSEQAKWITGGAVNEIEKLIWRETGYVLLGQGKKILDSDTWPDGSPKEAESFDGECAESAPSECCEAELSEPDKLRMAARRCDQADIIDLILSYRNPVDDETKLRQIKVVMD